jgi:hypothetical protein
MTTTSRKSGENPKRRFAHLRRHNGTIFPLQEYCKDYQATLPVVGPSDMVKTSSN